MIKCKHFESRFLNIDYNNFFHIEPQNFNIIIIKSGYGVFSMNGKEIVVSGPGIIFVNEKDKLMLVNNRNINLSTASFDPSFINVNLDFHVIHSNNYKDLCKKFGFPSFDLFYKRDELYQSFLPLNHQTENKLEIMFSSFERQLTVQPDERWSCRSRDFLFSIFDICDYFYKSIFIKGNTNEPLAERVMNYIYINIGEELSVNHLCDVFYTNRTTINSMFKNIAQCTLSEFIINKRIEFSKHALAFTELSLGEIAIKYGFRQQAYFSRIFKQKVGVSPNYFRVESVKARISAQNQGEIK